MATNNSGNSHWLGGGVSALEKGMAVMKCRLNHPHLDNGTICPLCHELVCRDIHGRQISIDDATIFMGAVPSTFYKRNEEGRQGVVPRHRTLSELDGDFGG